MKSSSPLQPENYRSVTHLHTIAFLWLFILVEVKQAVAERISLLSPCARAIRHVAASELVFVLEKFLSDTPQKIGSFFENS